MADDKIKVYTPTEIEETPFPEEVSIGTLPDTKPSGGVYSPKVIKDQPLPTKRIAHELISSALNTRSKKILQEFEFTPSGALQIGKYTNGVSGDTRITADGIVMRNKAGLTTLAQDGDTGDAIFAGQMRAGSTIVADTIVTEESSSGNGRTVYYNNGLPAIVIGDPD